MISQSLHPPGCLAAVYLRFAPVQAIPSPPSSGLGWRGAGVGRGEIGVDQWSEWQDARETYSAIPGFAKQVDRTPAKVSFSDLPAGKGFQIEAKLVSPEGQETLPKLDRLIANFE